MRAAALTTIDNPFDPFDQFDEWFAFDEQKGYHSCAYLARIVKTSDQLPEALQNQAVEDAIDRIVDLNVLGIYKKVIRETENEGAI